MNIFVDFEASSLGSDSYPIEIGWTTEAGNTVSRLIKPEPGWLDWSSLSALMHNIPRELLTAEGISAADVALDATDASNGATLLSDAPG